MVLLILEFTRNPLLLKYLLIRCVIFSGLQKLDGLSGNFVVRVPKAFDSNAKLYDFDLPEHKIFISDWLNLPADDHFPGLRSGPNIGQDANSFLLNGRGRTLVRDVKDKYNNGTIIRTGPQGSKRLRVREFLYNHYKNVISLLALGTGRL
jgi:hypothetical protein